MKKNEMHNISADFFIKIIKIFGVVIISNFFIITMGHVIYKSDAIWFNNNNLIFTIIVLSVGNFIMLSIFTSIIGLGFIKPIRMLNWATKEVAKGNYNINLETCSRNEIGDLMRNFNKMARELAGVEIMRSDFISSISHEFKTPLASIQGYADLLQDDFLTAEERREYTDTIISATKRLSALSSNILKLSKLENQEIIAEKSAFSLDEQIRRTILLLEPFWSAKDLDLEIDLEPTLYLGNEELLAQVWLNLLDNAIKYTGKGGFISVRLKEGESITAEISDNGIGMDYNTKMHMFDKFFQGDVSRSSEGSGLGLPLVKRIIELSGGNIKVESEQGKGSLFRVILPKV